MLYLEIKNVYKKKNQTKELFIFTSTPRNEQKLQLKKMIFEDEPSLQLLLFLFQ
jgi:hypothetical protein